MLGSADYTASNGTTVVLAAGATAGDLIETISFYVSSVLNAIPATAGAVNSTYITDGAVTTAKIDTGAVGTSQIASGITLTTPTLSSPVTSGTPTGVGVLTSGTAVASTSGTSVDFTGIPSWVKRITVTLSGVSTNGTSIKILQLGDSGGVETTGYLGSESNIIGTVGSAIVTNGFGIRSVSAADIIHGTLIITNLSGNTWAAFGVMALSNSASTLLCAGSKTLSDTLDRIRITASNGTDTFDAGSVNILYE
jgi:hypothetical protein